MENTYGIILKNGEFEPTHKSIHQTKLIANNTKNKKIAFQEAGIITMEWTKIRTRWIQTL